MSARLTAQRHGDAELTRNDPSAASVTDANDAFRTLAATAHRHLGWLREWLHLWTRRLIRLLAGFIGVPPMAAARAHEDDSGLCPVYLEGDWLPTFWACETRIARPFRLIRHGGMVPHLGAELRRSNIEADE